MKHRMTTKLMASIAFGGALGDPDFTNYMIGTLSLMPISLPTSCGKPATRFFFCQMYSAQLAHPLDDFIEAVIWAPTPKVIDAIMDEVDAIVGKYGGVCVDAARSGETMCRSLRCLRIQRAADMVGF